MAKKRWLRIKQRKHWREQQPTKAAIRGQNAEDITARAVAELVEEGVFSLYARAHHNDALDASHIDIVAVHHASRKLFVLQVKTKTKKKHDAGAETPDPPPDPARETPAERHMRKYPYIPVIEVRVTERRHIAVRAVKRVIKQIYHDSPSAERVLDKRTLDIIAAKFRGRGYDGPLFWEES